MHDCDVSRSLVEENCERRQCVCSGAAGAQVQVGVQVQEFFLLCWALSLLTA